MYRSHSPLANANIRNLLTAFFLVLVFFVNATVAEESPEGQTKNIVKKSPPVLSVPDIAEIVPLEIKLVGRLQELKKQLQTRFDGELLEKGYVKLEDSLDDLVENLDRLKESKEYKYNKLIDLRDLLKQKRDTFELINAPVAQSIRQLGVLRKDWQAESNRWSEWQTTLLKGGDFEQLRSTFSQATETINTALDLILSELDSLLAVQERAGIIERKVDTLYEEVDSQIVEERRNTLFNDTPPMLSGKYLAQINNSSLWKEVINDFSYISLPEREAVNQHGWIVLFQALIAFILIIFIQKRKRVFEQTERWKFLVLYPVASGFFLGYMATVLIYEYQGAPNSWKFVATIVGSIAFARLMQGVVDANWKARFIYGLVGIILVTRLLDILGIPIPVFRLYICFAALAGALFCLRLVVEIRQANKTGVFLWLLRAGVWFFAIVFIIEILGRKALAAYLLVSLIRSLGTVLIFVLLMYIIRGGLEWLFNTTLLRRSTSLNDSETDIITIRLTRFINILIVLLILVPAILMIWGLFQSLEEATRGVLVFGFNFGSNRVTIGLLIIFAAIIYSSFLISWVVQKLLIDQVLFQRRMEKGARISIARLVHYGIVVVGFMLAISALGIEITKLTIMISALGVGIGFGLQGIVNNFVSGLILLFEQPIRIGDLVEIGGVWAEIKHIGIRATIVRNFDHADMIIPNADLVSNQVTNWTLGDRQARLIIAAGVAYGSNVEVVMETLIGCAADNKNVTQSPSPQALFLNFGESSLDFELRVFVPASLRIQIRSELHKEIDKRFRENDISIAFPQRDLHLPGIEVPNNLMGKPFDQEATTKPE